MGRRILGVVVGIVTSFMAAGILFMILAMVLGEGGMINADRTPTTTWVVIVLACIFATSYLAGSVARAIGKDKQTTYIYLGLVVVLTGLSIAFAGAAGEPPKQEIPEDSPAMFKTLAAMGESMQNMPTWYQFANPILSLLGLALGGFNKSDFAPKSTLAQESSEPPAGTA
jgi:hypothetical protein